MLANFYMCLDSIYTRLMKLYTILANIYMDIVKLYSMKLYTELESLQMNKTFNKLFHLLYWNFTPADQTFTLAQFYTILVNLWTDSESLHNIRKPLHWLNETLH